MGQDPYRDEGELIMRKPGMYTRGYLLSRLAVIVVGSLVMGAAVTYAATRPATQVPSTVPAPSATAYVVPTGIPSPSLPPSEDSPGWDCRTQGNHVCRIDGELWLNLIHLPASLYARCLLV